jgi:hypothetical protein
MASAGSNAADPTDDVGSSSPMRLPWNTFRDEGWSFGIFQNIGLPLEG